MGNEVNEVINNICDKLGILANELIPEMGKMKVAELSIGVGIGVLLLLLAGIIAMVSYKKHKRGTWDDDGDFCMYMIMIFLIVIGFGILAVIAPQFAGWLISPKAKTFEYVLERM